MPHGILHKMRTELNNNTAQYYLQLGEVEIPMNDCIGSKISITYSGKITCVSCGVTTKTSFAQGYCYPCFTSVPQTEDCVLRPELCKAHEGVSRDMEYAKSHCLIPHYVYLAQTGTVKVGVTRHTQIPTRWIDQGAERAVIIAETPNRYTAGLLEVSLKKYIADKTNWRYMLTRHNVDEAQIRAMQTQLPELLEPELQQYLLHTTQMHTISYPGRLYEGKIQSCNLDKTPNIQDELIGIKGQYLVFAGGHVINIRKYGGYNIELTCL